ncbi:MAG: tyrosine-type recombinase/integrase [Salinisphaeraceae bacterium]
MLTVKELEACRPKSKAYRVADGQGLYLHVKPSGSRSWIFRYTKPSGGRTTIGLGPYPAVSARIARKESEACRELLASGIDPSAHRVEQKQAQQKNANTLSLVAEEWFAYKVNQGWAPATAEKCRTYLEKDILPRLGRTPVLEITRHDLNRLMESIEARGAFNVAEKVRQWLRSIFSFAIAKGYLESNPASELNAVAQKAPRATHYAYLLESQLPRFLQQLRQQETRSPRSYITVTAAWLVLLTGSRPGMVRYAEWQEFNLDDALWSVPAHKMKKRRPHLVPLSRQLVVMLRDLQEVTGRNPFLFPGRGNYGKRDGSVISERTIGNLFNKMGYKDRMTPHGGRHTASTVLNEHGWNPRWVDAQLSHKETTGPKVRGEYNHAIYLEHRREMMQWYADHLHNLELGAATVVAMSAGG